VLSAEQQKLTAREHKFDLLSLPFIFTWMVSLYLLPMQLMIKAYTSFYVTLVIFLISVAGIYFFWYLPGKEQKAIQPAPQIPQEAEIRS
jgi:hypothetical protein